MLAEGRSAHALPEGHTFREQSTPWYPGKHVQFVLQIPFPLHLFGQFFTRLNFIADEYSISVIMTVGYAVPPGVSTVGTGLGNSVVDGAFVGAGVGYLEGFAVGFGVES